MTNYSNKLNVSRGILIRKILPFDENTSSNDQSSVKNNSVSIEGIDPDTGKLLRDQAISIRKLIRVKMADEADLKQVIYIYRKKPCIFILIIHSIFIILIVG